MMCDIIVYLIQNFASHLLAAIITLYILKCLLQYCNTAHGSTQALIKNRSQLTGRRCLKRQDPLQRTRSNRNITDRSSHTFDRYRSRSKTRPNGRGKIPYILSQEGFLHPCVERETNIYTTTTANDKKESETAMYPGESSLRAKRFQSSFYPKEDIPDYLKCNSEEKANDTKTSTIKQEKCAKAPAENINKASIETRDYYENPPLFDATKPEESSSQGFNLSKKSSSEGVKRAKSNDKLETRKSDSEKQDKPGKEDIQSIADKVQKKNQCTNTVTCIDIKQNPSSKKPAPEISPKRANLTVSRKPPQYISCKGINDDELDIKSGTSTYASYSSSDDGCGLDSYMQDNVDSCMDMQKGDWEGTPYCMRSRSYRMPSRYCDQQTRRKCEPNSFKTVVIDFKPGYFLSCFSSCCKKLFANDSKEECVINKCKCSCSNCKYQEKGSKSESKTRERQNQINDKRCSKNHINDKSGSKNQINDKSDSQRRSQSDLSLSQNESDSKDECVTNKCKCGCSNCKYKEKDSKSKSKTEERQNQVNDKRASKNQISDKRASKKQIDDKNGSQLRSQSDSQNRSPSSSLKKSNSEESSKKDETFEENSNNSKLTDREDKEGTQKSQANVVDDPRQSHDKLENDPRNSQEKAKDSRKSQDTAEDDPRKSEAKTDDVPRKSQGKPEDGPRKSQDNAEDDPRKSQEKSDDDPRKSQTKSEEEPQKSENKSGSDKTVGFCNIGVSTNEDETYASSQSRLPLGRPETFRPGTVPPGQSPDPMETYDLLSSSSELTENSYFRSREKQESNSTFVYVKNHPLTLGGYSKELPLSRKPSKKRSSSRLEEPTLIGWRKEQYNKKEEIEDSSSVYDVSEISLLQNSSESSDVEQPLDNFLIDTKKRKGKINSSKMASYGSEENKKSTSRKRNHTNLTNFCQMYDIDVGPTNCDKQATDSEEKSSIDEEMAKDLVKSFRSILTEMTHTTLDKMKYKIKMNPRKRKRSSDVSKHYKSETYNNYTDSVSSSSENSIESDSKSDLKKESLKSPFSHHQIIINNVAINSSDNEENGISESNLDIKYSIEKNLAELASLLPSISQQLPSEQLENERQCTCRRSHHSIKKPSSMIKNSNKCYSCPSSDGNEVSRFWQEKRENIKTKRKSTENNTKTSTILSKKSSTKIPPMKHSLKKRFVKQSQSSSVKDLSIHRILSKDLAEKYSSEGNISKDIQSCVRPLKKCKTKKDLSILRKTKQSKSSPTIGDNDRNKRGKLVTRRKSMNACFPNLRGANELDSDRHNKAAKLSEELKSIAIGEDYVFKIIDPRINNYNEPTNSYSEKRKLDGEADVSLGTLDTNDLSSYTILDIGLQSGNRFPTVSLFPSNMNESWLVLQRQGSNDMRKYISEIRRKNEETPQPDMDGGPRRSTPTKEESSLDKYSKTRRRRKRDENEDGTYLSNDSDDSSDTDFRILEKSQCQSD